MRLRLQMVVTGAIAMVFAFASPARSQSPVAQLSGLVTDDTAGALPGVEVTVTQTGTGASRFVVTDTRGEYVFTNLPIGPYTLEAKLSGFSTFQQTGIVLNVGDTRSVNVTMKVGQLSETILVQADANMVETRSLAAGTLVTQDQMVGLPLNGRNATQLILLAGGAVESNAANGATDRVPGGAPTAISVSGALGGSTLYLVDGGYNNDPQVNSGNPIPFPDALQEFRTETGVRDARSGLSSGGTVNAVTKSGTNAFHGNAFEFMRDHRFNSIRFFEKKENGGLGRDDGLKRHQFGGTIGGPIMKDRLFFFFGVQATNNYNVPLSNDFNVLTADMLKGDFRKVMSADCRTTPAQLGFPFVNNQVDPALFHPLSLKMAAMVPVADPATDPKGCGNYPFRMPNDTKDQQYVSRGDYQVTKNKRVFFRDFIFNSNKPSVWNADRPNLLEQTNNGRGLKSHQHTIATGLDYVVTPKLFSATRFSYQYTETFRQHNPNVPTWKSLGVNTFSYTETIPGQDFLGGGPWGGALTGRFFVYTPSITQDFDWTLGSHSVSFGGSFTRPHTDGDGTIRSSGTMTFNGVYTSSNGQASGGNQLADFMLGYVQTLQESMSQHTNVYVPIPAAYVNDTWRMNRRLTFSYGLRWEANYAIRDINGFNMAFRRNLFDQGFRSTVYDNAPPGILYRGDPGFPTNKTDSADHLAQFAPRLGVVWDPNGDSKQTIRAGAGLYFNAPQTWGHSIMPIVPPWGNSTNAIHPGTAGATIASCPGKPVLNDGCPVDFLAPWSATPGGDPLAGFSRMGEPKIKLARTAKFPTNATYSSFGADLENQRVYQFNVSYQRQFPGRILADVTYTGNVTKHILTGYSENPTVYIPGNCVRGQYGLTADGPCSTTSTANRDARRILTLLNPTLGPMIGGVTQAYTGASGHYNGVKFTFNKRIAHGWSLSTNYTLSKCMNEAEPSQNFGNPFPVTQIDPFTNPVPDPSSNYGKCTTDRRHLYNLSSVYVSPGLPMGGNLVHLVTKDWQVGLIVQTRSGSPITVGQANDPNLTNGVQRGQIVPGVDPYLSKDKRVVIQDGSNTRLAWFNPAAFTVNPIGTYGDSPKGYLTGPSFWNTDLAFSRLVRLPSARTVELRLEAFNLFNHVNWANPGTVSVGSTNLGNFSVTNTAGDPRIMQFAIKYGF